MKVGVALADVIAGKDAVAAVLAGLAGRGRGRTADERHIFISLAQSAVAALVNVAQNALVSGRDVARWGNAHPNLVPYQLFDAADRSIVIAVGSDAQWRSCARALGLDEMAADATLRTNAGRLAKRDRIVHAMASRVIERTAAEWVAALATAGVPAGIVRSVHEALADVSASPLTGIAPNAPGTVRLPPPMLDEHGVLIRERGWEAFRRVATGAEASDALHR
jgi:crotonobetainyl-CoA:carnitine CoA-transferase CaiB-like acyl-CoA transferase